MYIISRCISSKLYRKLTQIGNSLILCLSSCLSFCVSRLRKKLPPPKFGNRIPPCACRCPWRGGSRDPEGRVSHPIVMGVRRAWSSHKSSRDAYSSRTLILHDPTAHVPSLASFFAGSSARETRIQAWHALTAHVPSLAPFFAGSVTGASLP